MIHFITKYDVYKACDFLVKTTAAKQNVKNVVWNFPPMTALNDTRKRRTPSHQNHRARKTPGEPRKRKTRRTEMLVLASKVLLPHLKRKLSTTKHHITKIKCGLMHKYGLAD